MFNVFFCLIDCLYVGVCVCLSRSVSRNSFERDLNDTLERGWKMNTNDIHRKYVYIYIRHRSVNGDHGVLVYEFIGSIDTNSDYCFLLSLDLKKFSNMTFCLCSNYYELRIMLSFIGLFSNGLIDISNK